MKIYRNTVTDTLWKVLNDLMEFQDLEPFRLEHDFDPICMKDKTWGLIKLDLEDRKTEYLKS